MHLNEQEQQIWNENKEFFAPGGIPNNEAYQAYLGKYSQLGQYRGHTGFPQQQLLGVLLKHAPDMAFQTAFALYYPQFRTGNQSAEFDAWLGEFAAARPEALSTALKTIAPNLNFTQQVMVLRDVQRWFPGSSIKEYTPPKLLKTKPSVILKQFNPTLVDMPYLLAMSASLMQDTDPQSKALGDTIARGSFIARYGMAPESDEKNASQSNRATTKYCTTEAFAMLVRHGIDMDPATLLQQVQLRYNAQTMVLDALAYPVMVFEASEATQEERDYAMRVLHEVVGFIEKEPDHAAFAGVVESALSRVYGACPEGAMKQRIEDVMAEHIRTATPHGYANARTYGDVLSAVASAKGAGQALLLPLAQRVVDAVPNEEQLLFLQSVTVGAHAEAKTLRYQLARCELAVQNAFFALLAPNKTDEYISNTLQIFFDTDAALVDSTSSLKEMFQKFAAFKWDSEKATAFRESPLAATSILLYLYMTASGNSKNAESTHNYGTPFTQWTPLPFLKKMYPEKMPLWNQMTVGLLQMPMADNEAASKMQYQRVMGSMFQAFSQAFLADGPSLAITQGIIESLGANPLDYFMDAHKKSGPIMDLDLPQDMFAFD